MLTPKKPSTHRSPRLLVVPHEETSTTSGDIGGIVLRPIAALAADSRLFRAIGDSGYGRVDSLRICSRFVPAA